MKEIIYYTNKKSGLNLTYNKGYEVVNTTRSNYLIKNDNNKPMWYSKEYFSNNPISEKIMTINDLLKSKEELINRSKDLNEEINRINQKIEELKNTINYLITIYNNENLIHTYTKEIKKDKINEYIKTIHDEYYKLYNKDYLDSINDKVFKIDSKNEYRIFNIGNLCNGILVKAEPIKEV